MHGRILPFVIISTSSLVEDLIVMVSLKIMKWELLRKEFMIIKLNEILFTWKTLMKCGPFKERRLILWSLASLNMLKFNVDGVSEGKLEAARIGRMFCKYKGKGHYKKYI